MTINDLLELKKSSLDALAATQVMGWKGEIFNHMGLWRTSEGRRLAEDDYTPSSKLELAWKLQDAITQMDLNYQWVYSNSGEQGRVWCLEYHHPDTREIRIIDEVEVNDSEFADTNSDAHAITALAVFAVGL